jgi:hypothetical protein
MKSTAAGGISGLFRKGGGTRPDGCRFSWRVLICPLIPLPILSVRDQFVEHTPWRNSVRVFDVLDLSIGPSPGSRLPPSIVSSTLANALISSSRSRLPVLQGASTIPIPKRRSLVSVSEAGLGCPASRVLLDQRPGRCLGVAGRQTPRLLHVACVGEVGDTSIAVKIETWARERGGKRAEKVTEGVFTYVAIDEKGHPRKLAPRDGDRSH